MSAPMSNSLLAFWRRTPTRTAVLTIWFTVLWVALWGSVTWANVIGGLVVAIGVLTLARLPVTGAETLGNGRFRPVRAVGFLFYFAYKVVQSNLILARQVLSPRLPAQPGILALDLRGCSDAVVTLVANAITLTPGTLTIEVRRHPSTIYVHVLDLHDPVGVRADLARLAHKAVRAFGEEAAVAQFDQLFTGHRPAPRTDQPPTATEGPK